MRKFVLTPLHIRGSHNFTGRRNRSYCKICMPLHLAPTWTLDLFLSLGSSDFRMKWSSRQSVADAASFYCLWLLSPWPLLFHRNNASQMLHLLWGRTVQVLPQRWVERKKRCWMSPTMAFVLRDQLKPRKRDVTFTVAFIGLQLTFCQQHWITQLHLSLLLCFSCRGQGVQTLHVAPGCWEPIPAPPPSAFSPQHCLVSSTDPQPANPSTAQCRNLYRGRKRQN